jgi:trk system potassium uptake protein TrkA
MKNAKHILVLGLDAFGAALAIRLSQHGCQVTGVDRCEDRVNELKDELYQAVVADVTDRESLEELYPENADWVIVSLGNRLEASLLTTLHSKELGAKHILAKAVTADHGKLLGKLDVERVVFPEEEIASHVADRIVWPNVLDFLPIDPHYSVVEIAVPGSLVGSTLGDSNLRQRHGVSVLGVKDMQTGRLEIIPQAGFRLAAHQLLLAIGRTDDLDRFRELS